jgi:glycosyltransferase involved in cell wall biosynthesis
MPTVSVIVPNYNHARFLPKRVESVLRQTYQDFELILLDDCSTDDSRAILSQYAGNPRVRIEFNDANSGSTFKQWNKGVRLARGRYVWIAESDDYADERLLETLVSRLETEPTAVLVNCRSWRVSAAGEMDGFWDSSLSYLDPQRWGADFSADGREECRRYLVHCNTVQSASSVLFRRETYWRAGGADEDFVLGGDWKTWVSMALVGGRICHVGEPLNYCRFHDASVSENSLRSGVWAEETLRVVAWILERIGPEDRARVCDGLAHLWISAVLDSRIPRKRRWRILRDAAAVDPRALRKMFHPVLVALRSAVSRRFGALVSRV